MCFINCSRKDIKLGKEVIITWPDKIKYNGIVHKITKHYITIWYKDDIDESEYGSITNHPIKYLRFQKVRKRKKKKELKKSRSQSQKKFKEEPEPEPVKKCVCLSDEFTRLFLSIGNKHVARLLLGLFN